MRSFIRAPRDSAFSARGALAPDPSDHVDEVVLAAGAAKTVAIPAGAEYALFSANGDFRVKFGVAGVTAAIPAGDILDGTGSELNPAARRISEGLTHVSLIAEAATNVTISYFGA